ncbi:MAG: flagellar hook-associated protein FlgK [Treponemataceae bacterium]
MQSTFTGIEIGKRSVVAHQQALATTGHNLSNASTEGYSRQRVEFSPFEPIYLPGLNREETPGQIGQGTVVERIERLRDGLLEKRIVSQANGEGYWDNRDKYVLMLERIYNEPADVSVRGRMDAFWDSWQELSLHPADSAPRKAVIERGKTLVDSIHERYKGLSSIRDMLEQDIQGTVSQVNDLTNRISGLNEEIQKIKAQGDNPNDLYDRRDLLVEKLAGIINIETDQRDSDEFMIHTNGNVLVQGRVRREFALESGIETGGFSRITWKESGENAYFSGGSLASMVQLRDVDVRGEIQSLDSMAVNFTDLVNDAHRAGTGLNGRTGIDFFVERPFVTNVAGNYDRNGDGQYDSTYVFRISGANKLEERAQIGLEGKMTFAAANGTVDVPYYATDTVADVVARINHAGAEVVARLDREGRLSLKGTPAVDPANPDFVIRHVEDSGRFLEGYAGVLIGRGADASYDWARPDAVQSLQGGSLDFAVAPVAHPSGWIEVNPALIKDPQSIAAGYGQNGKAANPGNGDAALAIASIRNTPVMVGQHNTFDDYFADAVARVGLMGEQSDRALESQNLIMKQLRDMRQSISGVNVDEELSQMIKYQHGYAAAARFISTMNDMLDTIINRMGV